MGDLTIYKANSLVEAGYRLSLTEQRVISLSLACIDTQNISNKTVTVYASDLAEKMGVSQKLAVRDLKLAMGKLFDRYITLKNENETRKFRWIQEYAEYHEGEASVSFTYSDRILPLIFELKLKEGNFTTYNLLNISGFSNSYSFRIYELAIKMKNMQNPLISVDEIRRILQLENKYPLFKDLNKFVFKKAIDDINLKSDILIDLEPVRRGRKIVSLKFKISQKQQKKRPKFPHKNKYGRYVKLDTRNPKMSSHEYSLYAQDCLKILNDFYTDISEVTTDDLRNYWVFLAVNDSHTAKLGRKKDFLDELKKRGYKLVECELVKL